MKPGIYTTEQPFFLYEMSTKESVPTPKDIATEVATGELLIVL
jgi:hypothetical protein